MAGHFETAVPHADELISMRVAFLTAQRFLEMFWERGLKQNEEMGMLLSAMDMSFFSDGSPIDPAQWHDFVLARDDVVGRLVQ
ncbi:hypothetical protein [Polymorphobacter fuscus]|uniref:Uncharacterized protein n=1 Tax=Sandarakinorhabdus fusca TaxID=1439888 RepID=A0A7C9GQ04_9SPHN|nr:hypothetical protein [Polymorphobacter fuscus]KAB7645505.1 hypothetical protein F9290_11780 [Polymorphobacter fuscus]MQT17937.1 hypothetical protein [Polymorphobacter fuscus]NJC08567.1 hypothetical protein [Polymorphobacter fuscus]